MADTFVLKGFAENSAFIQNQPGITNQIGELSPNSLTYSRNVGRYSSTRFPDISLVSFCTETNGKRVVVDDDLKERVIAICDWVYKNTQHTSGELYADQIVIQLMNNFLNDIADMLSGEMVSDGVYWVPTWLSWTDVKSGAGIRIWFGDENFTTHYDEYEIAICPPMDNIDDFFRSAADVSARLSSRNITDTYMKITDAKNGHPETVLRGDIFNYYDPNNPKNVIQTVWSILVYGAAGDDIDKVKDALIEYILTHTAYTREQWTAILPDIFRRTEFTLTPDWWSYAIPEKQTQSGIYSPLTSLGYAQKLVALYTPSYDQQHVDTHTTSVSFPYKSLSVYSSSCQENRNGKFLLSDYFPDYIGVSTSSQDFNRMCADTRGFVALFARMLIVAETMSLYSAIPKDMTRLVRDGILYVVCNYQNVHYLVVAKTNANPLIVPPND